ncbi:unnamed protein product [Moneuplotes crassus]|uniref:PHD-type domain-containing protein n=1 Tax=Euplotes crassus TaxID=5936 RepID=A0AAD2DBX6_EUPCR|nr:unnamed protein product [Moneuplotes crassus]
MEAKMDYQPIQDDEDALEANGAIQQFAFPQIDLNNQFQNDYNQQHEDLNHLLCDTCNVGVHQSCYGKDLGKGVPGGEWNCERCEFVWRKKRGDFRCCVCRLCRKSEGCLVKVQMWWYHVQCVNWTSEIYFEDYGSKKKLGGSLAKEECMQVQKDTCTYCNIDDCYCIKCDILECNEKFCVRCASNKGIIREDTLMESHKHPDMHDVVYIFCERHINYGVSLVQNKEFNKLRLDPIEIEENAKAILEKKEKRNNIKKRNERMKKIKRTIKKRNLTPSSTDSDSRENGYSEIKDLKKELDSLKYQYSQVSNLLIQGMLGKNANPQELLSHTNNIVETMSKNTSRRIKKVSSSNVKTSRRKKKIQKPRCETHSSLRNCSKQHFRQMSQISEQLDNVSLNSKTKKRSRKAEAKKQDIPILDKLATFKVLDQAATYFCLTDEIYTYQELQKEIIEYFEKLGMYDTSLQIIKVYLCPRARALFQCDIVPKDSIVEKLFTNAKIVNDSADSSMEDCMIPSTASAQSELPSEQSSLCNSELEEFLKKYNLSSEDLLKIASNPQLMGQLEGFQ